MNEFPELIAAADAANPMGRMGDCEEDIGPVAVLWQVRDRAMSRAIHC